MRFIIVQNRHENPFSQPQIAHPLLPIILEILRLPQHPRTLPYSDMTIPTEFPNDDFLDEFSESYFWREGERKVDYATDCALGIWWRDARDGEEF